MDRMSRKMRRMMGNVTTYPLELRIAAVFVGDGFTEEDWVRRVKQGDFSGISDPTVTKVHNYIRDITKGSYSISDIPYLSED